MVFSTQIRDIEIIGQYAYLMNGADEGLYILDISIPAHPDLLGHTPFVKMHPHSGRYKQDIAVSGNYAFISDTDYFRAIDISNPGLPAEIAIITPDYTLRGIGISGTNAYLAADDGGILAIDISDPASPQIIGQTMTANDARDITVVEGRAYISTLCGMEIYRIVDPQGLIQIGNYEQFGVYSIEIIDNFAYLTTDNVHIINIDDPGNPICESVITTRGSAVGVTLTAKHAFIAEGYNGVCVIDISKKTDPQEVGYWDTGGYVTAIDVVGQYAYVADALDGLRVIDVSDPYTPCLVGFYDAGRYPEDIAVSGDKIYATYGYDGIRILNYMDPNHTSISFDEKLPHAYHLHHNHPNPFNAETRITYAIPKTCAVTLDIFDIMGRNITTLVKEKQEAGMHAVLFQMDQLPSGIYVYRLKAGEFTESKTMHLIR